MSTRPPLVLPFFRRAVLAALLSAATAGALLVTGASPSGSVAAAASPDAWLSPSGGSGNAMTDAGESVLTTASAGRVARAWTAGASNAETAPPTVVGGVVYYLHQYINTTDPDTLVAASTRTGATLWSAVVAAPNARFFGDGVTIAGHLALTTFQDPAHASGGLLAVDTTTHRVVWTRTVAANTAQDWAWSGHPVVADGTRAYVHLADGTLSAYRLTDGALLWTIRLPDNQNVGTAVGPGALFVGFHDVTGAPTTGITAYDLATGRALWTAPGEGTPVVAGGRVFTTRGDSVVAVNAAGCGRATCPALWTKTLPGSAPRYVTLGAADASTVVVTYQRTVPANRWGDTYSGVISRLSASTGAQQRTWSAGDYISPAVRGGDVLWVVDEYRDGGGNLAERILGLPAAGSSTSVLRDLAAPQDGFPQSLAVGGGAVLDQTNRYPGLVAYRVPGA